MTTQWIKGVDLSSLYEEEGLGAKYFDSSFSAPTSLKSNPSEPNIATKTVPAEDVFEILSRYGINYLRLKLWNDPYDSNRHPYGAGTNDLATDLSLARRALKKGWGFLLNFHYSDFWADPGKQILPKAWKNYSEEELIQAVHDYTKDTLEFFQKEHALPTMVQIGNEITNGLLWPLGKKPWPEEMAADPVAGEKQYERIARLVSSGIRAVREVDPSIRVMIHLDHGGNNAMYVDWLDHYQTYATEDFDILGMSYYPFWHGAMKDLVFNMSDCLERYHKDIVIDEVSMGFTMEDYASYEQLSPSQRKGYATKPHLVEGLEYPMTKEGQCAFMKDLMGHIASLKDENNTLRGLGFFYWEPAWIPVPGCGWANDEALAYTKEKGPGGNEWANQALFDYDGHALPALKTIRDFNPC